MHKDEDDLCAYERGCVVFFLEFPRPNNPAFDQAPLTPTAQKRPIRARAKKTAKTKTEGFFSHLISKGNRGYSKRAKVETKRTSAVP
mmetsp:Transcript_12404/g.27347  ORF Transcript_12404/g.27347 Transcript_12404/m.27347 type:complete len:87 (-) Transcript_12404:240-500(-)